MDAFLSQLVIKRDCEIRVCDTRARFLSLARSKLRLWSANHRADYFSNHSIDLLACMTLKFHWWPPKFIGNLFYSLLIISKPSANSNRIYSPETPNSIRFVVLLVSTWNWRMTLKTIGYLFYATSGFVHHFITIVEFKLGLQSGNTSIGAKFALTSDLIPWPFAWTTHLSVVITIETRWYVDRNIVKKV